MIRSLRAMLLLLLLLSAAPAAEPPAQRLDEQGDPLPAHALARLGSTRWRQQWSIVDLSYSTDGKLLAARSYEEGFCLWDAASGKRLFKLPLEESSQWFTACSGDARVVAVANQRGKKVELRDSRNGKLLDEYEVQGPTRMALSADGSLLAVQTWDAEQSMIHIWDRGKAALVRKWKCEAAQLVFDGQTLVTGDKTRLRIWDAATGKERRRIEVGAALFALSLDGRTLAVRESGGVRLLDFASGRERRRLAVADAELDTRFDRLALSADGAVTALAGNGFVFAWDASNGQERFRRLGNFWANTVTFSPTSGVLTWGCMYDPAIHRWDLQKGEAASPGHESWVQSVAFSPDGRTLASGSTDRTVRFWDLKPAKGPAKPVLPTGESRLLALILGGKVAWSPDGKRLAVLEANNINLVDPTSGKVVQTLACSSPCYCLAFSPDGKLLAGGDSDHGKSSNPRGRAAIWEIASGKQIQLLEGHGDTVRSLAFAPDGKTLASGSDGVRLWEVATGKQVGSFRHGRFIDAMAFTPDGKTLAAGGESAVLWDVASGKDRHRLPGAGHVPGLAISPDGKLLATGGLDKMVRLWDVATGNELIQLPGHSGRVHAVAFSPDGRHLASGSEDTTILLWDVIGTLIAR